VGIFLVEKSSLSLVSGCNCIEMCRFSAAH
jgi:hypothetical protein